MRTLAMFLPSLLCIVSLARAAEPVAEPPAKPAADTSSISEAELIEAALRHPGFVAQQDAEVDLAQSERLAARRRFNPRLEYNREQIMTPRPQGEDYLILSQTFDISGRRALRSAAATQRIEATEQKLEGERIALVAELRRIYALTLHAQEHERVCVQWLALLDEVLEHARAHGGTDRRAQLDVLRIEKEIEQAVHEHELVHDNRIAGWTSLRQLALDPDLPVAPLELAGPLAPELHTQGEVDMPELRALELEAEAAERELAAARRMWVPNLTLLFGYKGVQMLPGHGHGFVAGFALTMPIVDVGRAERRRAEALLVRARAQSSRAHERLAIAHEGLEARLADADVEEPESKALLLLAREAYAAGEIDSATVVDSYHAWIDGEEEKLDRALQARLAQIELDRLDGLGDL